MREIGPASEDEMVLAFVRAEFHSRAVGEDMRAALDDDERFVDAQADAGHCVD